MKDKKGGKAMSTMENNKRIFDIFFEHYMWFVQIKDGNGIVNYIAGLPTEHRRAIRDHVQAVCLEDPRTETLVSFLRYVTEPIGNLQSWSAGQIFKRESAMSNANQGRKGKHRSRGYRNHRMGYCIYCNAHLSCSWHSLSTCPRFARINPSKNGYPKSLGRNPW